MKLGRKVCKSNLREKAYGRGGAGSRVTMKFRGGVRFQKKYVERSSTTEQRTQTVQRFKRRKKLSCATITEVFMDWSKRERKAWKVLSIRA